MELLSELEDLETSSEQLRRETGKELTKAGQLQEEPEDDQAYEQCLQLLVEQMRREEEKYQRQKRQTTLEMQTNQERIALCQQEKIDRVRRKGKVEEEIQDLVVEAEQRQRRRRKHGNMNTSIRDLRKSAESDTARLQEIKEESYEIKNQFLKLQEEEMRLLRQMGELE